MSSTINVKTLRNEMGRIIARVRSRPVFRIVPLNGVFTHGVVEDDSLYRAEAVGRSDDGLTAAQHDRSLCGWPRARSHAVRRHGRLDGYDGREGAGRVVRALNQVIPQYPSGPS